MKKISWCKKQSRGIKLIEPNDNLSDEYYQTAEESLKVFNSITEIKSNVWLATTKYYIELGLKGVSSKLEKDKELRIDNQYYLKNVPVDINTNELSEFLLLIKKCLSTLTTDSITKIRNKLPEI